MTSILAAVAVAIPALAGAQTGGMDNPPPVPGPYNAMARPAIPRPAVPDWVGQQMPYWMQAPAQAANASRTPPQYPALPQPSANARTQPPQFRFVPGWGWMPVQQGQGQAAPQPGWGFMPGYGQFRNWPGYGAPPVRQN
ncbi:MAG: hypothetical protein K8F59_14910 [Rhodobacteraceae bacterium]|nr:hypothetical protein [Paracoccaceae bacterium]